MTALKDDNARLQAGELPTDHTEGTRPVGKSVIGAQPAEPRERLRTEGLTLTELLAIEFPPPVWIVEGLIQEASTHCIFGPPNGGKTFLAIDIVMKTLAARKRVLFYEAEGSAPDLQLRLRRALAANEVVDPDLLRVFHDAEIDLTRAEGLAAVLAHADAHKPDLIVFDSLAAMSGNIDENDAAAMIHLSNVLNTIKTEICSVIALHHMTKEGWTGDTPTLRTLRGHGSLPGRLDVAIAVLPVDDQTTDTELVFDVFDVKRRDGPKHKRRRCTVAMPKAGEAATLRLFDIDDRAVRASTAKKNSDDIGKQMIEAVKAAMPVGLLTTELREQVSGKNGLKSDALRALMEGKKLVRRRPDKGERTGRLVLTPPAAVETSDAD